MKPCGPALAIGCVLLAGGTALAAMPAGSAAKGAVLFKSNCAACHSASKGGGVRQGPNLHDVYGRKVGSVAGFAYSSDFAKHHFVWNAQHLDKYLTQPTSVIADSYMMYQQPNPQIRADIIAYLKSLDHA